MKLELPPEFDDCPRYCARFSEKERGGNFDFCNGCDVKSGIEEFEEGTQAMLIERLGEKAKHYSLESLISAVNEVYQLKDFDEDELTPATDILVGVIISLENKQKRIELYNMKQKRGR
jgi:hypothetical protein